MTLASSNNDQKLPVWVEGNLAVYKPGYFIERHEVDPKTVGEYVEILDAYEHDVLYGEEKNEFGSLLSSWTGTVKYNEEKSRIMIFDDVEELWCEVDDYSFDSVIGNQFDYLLKTNLTIELAAIKNEAETKEILKLSNDCPLCNNGIYSLSINSFKYNETLDKGVCKAALTTDKRTLIEPLLKDIRECIHFKILTAKPTIKKEINLLYTFE